MEEIEEDTITGKQWEKLISRIALRALVEYRKPFVRQALRRHLPDLALADPLLPDETGRPTHRLLESDLDRDTIAALLTDERPKHQKRNLPVDHPRYDTLRLYLQQELGLIIERASASGEAEDWQIVAFLLSLLDRIGNIPTEQQRWAMQQGIEAALSSNIERANILPFISVVWDPAVNILEVMDQMGVTPSNEKRHSVLQAIQKCFNNSLDTALRYDDWGYWFEVAGNLPLLKRVGAIPDLEQMLAIRKGIQQSLATELERAGNAEGFELSAEMAFALSWIDSKDAITIDEQHRIVQLLDTVFERKSPSDLLIVWELLAIIINMMDSRGSGPTNVQKRGIAQAINDAIDRTVQSGHWTHWYTVSSSLQPKIIGELITDDQKMALRQVLQPALDAVIRKADQSAARDHGDKVSNILKIMERLGLVRVFVGGPAMTLEQVQQELEDAGAEFAEVPPLYGPPAEETSPRGLPNTEACVTVGALEENRRLQEEIARLQEEVRRLRETSNP